MVASVNVFTNGGKDFSKLIGWTINFNKDVPVSVGAWSNVTATLPAYAYVTGAIKSIGKADSGDYAGKYYATWEQNGKTCGVIFGSLDDILNIKAPGVVATFLSNLGIANAVYKWLYENTKPAAIVIEKAVAAGKAIVSGAATAAGAGLDIIKFVGDNLALLLIVGGYIVFRPQINSLFK